MANPEPYRLGIGQPCEACRGYALAVWDLQIAECERLAAACAGKDRHLDAGFYRQMAEFLRGARKGIR